MTGRRKRDRGEKWLLHMAAVNFWLALSEISGVVWWSQNPQHTCSFYSIYYDSIRKHT